MNLENKRILITGGTSGIGFALAAQAKRKGARVLICGRDGDRLAEACERLGVEGVRCDLGDPSQLVGLLEAAEHRLGGLDVLVNNAGIQRHLALTDEDLGGSPDDSLCRELDVNLAAPIHLTTLAMPRLKATAASGGAAVVFVTSALALVPKASAPVYCASKAGLRSFAKAIRHQLRPYGVRVLEVVPPVVDTAMTAGRDEAKLAPEVVATEILEALESGREELRVGRARMLFHLHRLLPHLAERILAGS